MMVGNVLKITRCYIYLMSVILLITTIKTKNRNVCKNSIAVCIFSIIYLFFSIFGITNFLGIDIGWGIFESLFYSIISSIILIITSIIAKKKLNKQEIEDTSNKFIKHFVIIFILIPIVMFGISVLRELYFMKRCDTLITFNYQNGIIISEDTMFTIGNDFCEEISIDSDIFINRNYIKTDSFTYDVRFNELDNEFVIESYNDENLEFVNKDIIKYIFEDVDLKEDEKDLHNAYINKIDKTNYYIASHYIATDETSGGGTVKVEYIYNGTKRIDKINCHGHIDEIKIYE